MNYSTEKPWKLTGETSLLKGFDATDREMFYRVTDSLQAAWLNYQKAAESYEKHVKFTQDAWVSKLGTGCTSVLTGGELWEKIGVAFSCVGSDSLPAAALEKRKDLDGKSWIATGVSLVFHPYHPKVPTVHLNARFFIAKSDNKTDSSSRAESNWWFGGGYDLTPWHPNTEDCMSWHRSIKAMLDQFSPDYYPDYKEQCDDYFWMPHRNRMRGIGGIFYDNLNAGGFEHCFEVCCGVADKFLASYLPIVDKNRDLPFDEKDVDCQLNGRSKYAEFNLLYDRGTKFGLQSSGRVESILVSMPPRASWHYQPVMSELDQQYLPFYQPFDWINAGKS